MKTLLFYRVIRRLFLLWGLSFLIIQIGIFLHYSSYAESYVFNDFISFDMQKKILLLSNKIFFFFWSIDIVYGSFLKYVEKG